MVLAALVVVLGGAGVLVVGWLAGRDRLPRNGWAGIRTMTTLRDDETWYAAHRAGSWWLVAGGAIALAIGLLLLAWRPAEAVTIVLLVAAGVACGGCAIVAGVLGQLAARSVVRSRDG